MTVSSWWKRLVCGIWTFVSYNLWLFAAWLLILGTHRWPVISSASDQLLVIVRSVALSDIGNNLRNDCLLLYKHPLFFLASFLFFVFMTKRFVSSSSVEVSPVCSNGVLVWNSNPGFEIGSPEGVQSPTLKKLTLKLVKCRFSAKPGINFIHFSK